MPIKYESPSVSIDIVIFTIENRRLKVLLIKRTKPPFSGTWALPGGFIHEGETTLTAARRILGEKAGVHSVYLEQLYTFDDLGRDPRGHVISIAYFALVRKDALKINRQKDLQEPTLHEIGRLPRLAFDHKKILAYAQKRLSAKLEYTNIVFSLLPRHFSFYELQKTYEIILKRKLDKRNFRKKFIMLGLIKPTAKVLSGKKQRPAKLYRFISKKPAELKKFF